MAETEFVTFGCRLNSYESEVMRDHAAKANMTDTIVFNTCAVTSEASRQARQAIRKAHKDRPDAKIIVTGCAAQTTPEMFADMPEVSMVLGNEEKLEPRSWQPGANARVRVGDIMLPRTNHLHMIERLSDHTRAFVQVQNGCDHRCTFCIIPFGRGNSRSVPIVEAVEQVKRFVGSGYSEVILSGVDLTSWGPDLEGSPRLGALVGRILQNVPELKRLRLSSIDSIEVDPELVDHIVGEKRLLPHLHLSLQSGDNMILKRMKRRHSREHAIAFCADIKSRRPDMVFGADVIAGFPTEDEVMFKNSLALIDDCDLTYLHVFPFSPRPETPAAKMPAVAGAVIKERVERLRAKAKEKLRLFLQKQIGTVQTVLVEANNTGRTDQFAHVKFQQAVTRGAIIKATITGATDLQLEARLGT
jgi:threonylcarbamoyladenosine tRNA methylthiotransferase MtaB